jgi:hypothetical protein
MSFPRRLPIGPAFLAAWIFALGLAATGETVAGNVFLSGHDPDFHASQGLNAAGAQDIIKSGLNFARNGSNAPILLLETDTSNLILGDHADSELGLIASGYTAGTTPGNHYVKVSATQFATTDLSAFSALFIPSDHGGTLTGADLQALNARVSAISAYLNAGGGLVAFAEDGIRQPSPTNPQPANFGFLPFSSASSALEQSESGYTLTPFGASLGLTSNDIDGNASHSIFGGTGGLNVVDRDSAGNIISLAGTVSAAVPEPSSALMIGTGLLGAICLGRRPRRRPDA